MSSSEYDSSASTGSGSAKYLDMVNSTASMLENKDSSAGAPGDGNVAPSSSLRETARDMESSSRRLRVAPDFAGDSGSSPAILVSSSSEMRLISSASDDESSALLCLDCRELYSMPPDKLAISATIFAE